MIDSINRTTMLAMDIAEIAINAAMRMDDKGEQGRLASIVLA